MTTRILPQLKKTPTMKKRAIIIAKDVLAQLRAKAIIAKRGSYLSFAEGNKLPITSEYKVNNTEIELQPLVKSVLKNKSKGVCRACALGSMFLSKVNKLNDCKVPLRYLQNFEGTMSYLDRYDVDIDGNLGIAFTSFELDLIESAFENESFYYSAKKNEQTSLSESAIVMYKRLSSDNRLKAICKNIIRNKGRFVVS